VTEGKKVVLVGPMGAGKSTLGKIIAVKLGWPYFDNDAEMTSRYGHSQEVLATMSVSELHALESKYLADVLAESGPLITGAAASVVDYPENRELLKSATTIYLRIPLGAVIERAGKSGVGRQALIGDGASILTERYERRDPLYKEVSQATIDLTVNPESDAERLLTLISKN
jgi:shikimate kinase